MTSNSQAVAILYDKKNYNRDNHNRIIPGSRSLSLRPGTYCKRDLESIGIHGNHIAVSSIRLNPGATITVYTEDEFKGDSRDFSTSIPKLSAYFINFFRGTYNKKISSVIVNSQTTRYSKDNATKCNNRIKKELQPPKSTSLSSDLNIRNDPPSVYDPNSCSVYYTNVTSNSTINSRLRTYCDEGGFSMTESQLRATYGQNSDRYKEINTYASQLPEPGVCKVTLQDWKRPSNAPLFIVGDSTNVNRGPTSDWAFCFKEINTSNEFNTLKNTIPLTTNTSVTSSFKLYPELLRPGSQYGFNDTKEYARLTMDFMNPNFRYSNMKTDTCSMINVRRDTTIPTDLFGIKVRVIGNKSLSDSTLKSTDVRIQSVGVYNTDQTGRSMVLEQNMNKLTTLYRTLFTEEVYGKSVYIAPKLVSATVYIFGQDICNNRRIVATSTGKFYLGDFGVKRKKIHTYSDNMKRLADIREQLPRLNAGKENLEQQKRDYEAKYGPNTNFSNQAQRWIDIIVKQIDNLHDTVDALETSIEAEKREIETEKANYIQNIIHNSPLKNKELAKNGVPLSLITVPDLIIYFKFH